MKRGILIDSENKIIKEVEVSNLNDMYKTMNVDLITVALYIDDNNLMYVDDEGLLKSPKHFFYFEGSYQPFAGNGLILGLDDNGEDVSTIYSIEEIKSKTQFLSPKDALLKMEEIKASGLWDLKF